MKKVVKYILVAYVIFLALFWIFNIGTEDWYAIYYLFNTVAISSVLALFSVQSTNVPEKIFLGSASIIRAFLGILQVVWVSEAWSLAIFLSGVIIMTMVNYIVMFVGDWNFERLKSSDYVSGKTYLLVRKPLKWYEYLYAFVRRLPVGAVILISNGRMNVFKSRGKELRTSLVDEKRLMNAIDKGFKLIEVPDCEYKSKKYHILFNNCINGISINIKRLIK